MSYTQQEQWTYIGVRHGATRDLVHAWLDAKGRELAFGKLKGAVIGGFYDAQVTRTDDGAFESVAGKSVTWSGRQHDDKELIAAWQAEDRLTETVVARTRAERKAGQRDRFHEAMEPLLALYQASARTSAQRTAFVSQVIDYLYRH